MTRASRNAAMFRTYGRDTNAPKPAPRIQPMDDKLPGDGEWQWMLPWITLASGFVMALIVWSIVS